MIVFERLVLTLLTLLSCSRGEVEKDRIKELPGYGKISGRQWSGYVQVPFENTNAFVHYWLIENSEQKEDAPTIVWFQGGPGGSSLIGLFTENGPFTLNDFSFDEEGGIRVFDNPYSWHRLPANMLYVEHPAPTGFSKCHPLPCAWNDTSQSLVSYGFMVRFFDLYPEFAHQPFYFTGESYAGVLVPTLTEQILEHRSEENKHKAPWSLRGIALGNACPGNRVLTCTPYSGWLGTKVAVDFRYFHGMISDQTYEKILRECEGEWDRFEEPRNKKCRDLLEDPIRPVMSEAGDTYNMGGGYFLYDTCQTDLSALNATTHAPNPTDRGTLEKQMDNYMMSTVASLSLQSKFLENSRELPRPNSGKYYCGQERAALLYLNLLSVQKAINVKPTKFEFSTALQYEFTAFSLINLYRDKLVDKLDIFQYSGDADPCVPYVGTQKWVRLLGLETTHPWAPWTSPGNRNSPAGYLQVYKANLTENQFAFATIRDAGHMSPRHKPESTLHLIRMFLSRWQVE